MRAIVLLILAISSSAAAQNYIDLPEVLADAMGTNGTSGQCWGMVDSSNQGWITPAGGGGGSGTVTTVSVASANGFAGTVATATTTPAITLSTSITGLLKGNGTAISAASSGTDYAAPNANTTGSAGALLSTTSNPASGGTAKLANADNICWRNAGNTADTCITLDASNILSVGSSAQAITSTLLGKGSTASGTPVDSQIGITPATGSNIAGANLVLAGGNSTGTGVGGSVIVKVAPAGLTGSGTNTLTSVAEFGALGVTLGTATLKTSALYVAQNSSNFTGVLLKGTGTEWAFNFPSTNFGLGLNGSNSNLNLLSADSSFSYQPGNGGAGLSTGYGFEVAWSATQGAPTTYANIISHTAVTPMGMIRSRNTTANILLGYWVAGSSDRPSGGMAWPCSTQTSSSEVCGTEISSMNAGTLEAHMRIKSKGFWEAAGSSLPTVTCNANSATVETGSTGVYARFTIPATPGTSCAVTLPDTADSNPICQATDEGTSTLLVMVCSSGTACTITDAGAVAANKISFHCGAHT